MSSNGGENRPPSEQTLRNFVLITSPAKGSWPELHSKVMYELYSTISPEVKFLSSSFLNTPSVLFGTGQSANFFLLFFFNVTNYENKYILLAHFNKVIRIRYLFKTSFYAVKMIPVRNNTK